MSDTRTNDIFSSISLEFLIYTKTMTRKLPPLNALRAFEAAARHLSFAKAAEELNVTPAAISHQIKGLEAFLGVALFRRARRTIWLTEAGQAAIPDLRAAFDHLGAAVDRIRGLDFSGVITVSAAPSFAAKWLVPRLEGFRVANPEIDARVTASVDLVDFHRDQVDIGVRYGSGRYPGLCVDLLLTEEVVPVCSPGLRDGGPPLQSPDDLQHYTLIHDDTALAGGALPDWRMWLLAAGARAVDWTRGPRYSPSSVVIQAAIDGQGVALVGSVLVDADLTAGRLIRPFELTVPVDFAYYVVSPQATADRPKVRAFRDWLLAEAERYRSETRSEP